MKSFQYWRPSKNCGWVRVRSFSTSEGLFSLQCRQVHPVASVEATTAALGPPGELAGHLSWDITEEMFDLLFMKDES